MNLTNVIALRALILALGTVLAATLISGCASDAPAFAAASPFGGGTISQKVIDNEPRPPKQVVYRFDDHRYIESDPTGGFVGGCQGELFYVDEKLGIRTEFGGNKVDNPRGLFHVESPYVVVRDAFGIYVSFDQGRTFVFTQENSGRVDVAVFGDTMYLGSGGDDYRTQRAFKDDSVGIYSFDPDKRQVEVKYDTNRQSDLRLKEEMLAKVRQYKARFSDRDYFVCHSLPWRPSANKERETRLQQLREKP